MSKKEILDTESIRFNPLEELYKLSERVKMLEREVESLIDFKRQTLIDFKRQTLLEMKLKECEMPQCKIKFVSLANFENFGERGISKTTIE